MRDARSWPIRSILSVTHGYPIERRPYNEIISWLTGQESVSIFTIVRAKEPLTKLLLEQHPQLTVIACSPPDDDCAAADRWADLVEQMVGATLPISPLPPGEWQVFDEVNEALEVVPPEKVFVAPSADPDTRQ
ncbi:hypothetical protein [Actinomadura harenae]|uniref:Uncharacterized protein n=1 Tax=Actinomadura harenae TaxID=2483351 RepID=A0A3M2LV28_9ACTN|nr:hypothetical protein [Actinomadura harenae]RMI39865.1 hypothetical protein EBO15_28265 [Actinomadura harenae]